MAKKKKTAKKFRSRKGEERITILEPLVKVLRVKKFMERIDYIMAERGWDERTVLMCVAEMFETERDLGEQFIKTLRETADAERAEELAAERDE